MLFRSNINQGLYAFAIGIVFAYMVEATGSLWSSVIAHFAINTYSIGVVQLLKMTGIYASDGQAVGTLEGEGELAASAGALATVMQLIVLLALATAFMMLAVLCIRIMAKRHGRLENIKVRTEGIKGIKKYLSAPVVDRKSVV